MITCDIVDHCGMSPEIYFALKRELENRGYKEAHNRDDRVDLLKEWWKDSSNAFYLGFYDIIKDVYSMLIYHSDGVQEFAAPPSLDYLKETEFRAQLKRNHE